ncbi:ADP-ribosylation [Gymnopus androsaceus JB14]|uniref:ADP-ribosylation n=1 Tax=Gymnopus androsaceus JB14 TaxID=1447944 RepID=A0A6A4HL88_9AGAR|nr:ADP-ribosylation [Gymnopus androsaceus JB14]
MNFIDLTVDSDDEKPTDPFRSSKDIESNDDSDIELLEIAPVQESSSSGTSARSALPAVAGEHPASFHSSNKLKLDSISSQKQSGGGKRSSGPKAGPSSALIDEDARFARRLQAQERKEYRELMRGLAKKKEGIVFRTVINAADGTLEDGSPAHPDDLARFEPWKQLFQTTELGGYKLKRFHWIVNYELEQRFEEAKQSLIGMEGVDDTQELSLFHGTPAPNIDSILEGGFRIGGTRGQRIVNGKALGYGIYLAQDASTSCCYAADANKIFACRVFPGRITNDRMYSNKPPKTQNPVNEMYHTYTTGSIYVARYASLVLPCYMIEFEFEQPDYNRLMKIGMAPGGNYGVGLAGVFGGGGIPPPPPPAPGNPGIYNQLYQGMMDAMALAAQPGGNVLGGAGIMSPPQVPPAVPQPIASKKRKTTKVKAKKEVLGGSRPANRSRR